LLNIWQKWWCECYNGKTLKPIPNIAKALKNANKKDIESLIKLIEILNKVEKMNS
jgi:hypothetical protein